MSTSLINSLNRSSLWPDNESWVDFWYWQFGIPPSQDESLAMQVIVPTNRLAILGWFNALLNACLNSQHLTYIFEFPELFVLKSHIEAFWVDSTLEWSIVEMKGFFFQRSVRLWRCMRTKASQCGHRNSNLQDWEFSLWNLPSHFQMDDICLSFQLPGVSR